MSSALPTHLPVMPSLSETITTSKAKLVRQLIEKPLERGRLVLGIVKNQGDHQGQRKGRLHAKVLEPSQIVKATWGEVGGQGH